MILANVCAVCAIRLALVTCSSLCFRTVPKTTFWGCASVIRNSSRAKSSINFCGSLAMFEIAPIEQPCFSASSRAFAPAARAGGDTPNKLLDTSSKQRLCYQRVFSPFACAWRFRAVSTPPFGIFSEIRTSSVLGVKLSFAAFQH